MSEELAKNQNKQPATLKGMLSDDSIKNRFNELLGNKSAGFISSIINVAQSNKLLATAEPKSIIQSAVVAASLDLPIDKNLGFSWIVPYGNQAQFQMGYKGFIQLALRTGQYTRLNVIEVYENQFKSYNAMTEELDADFSIDGDGKVKGYACYFRLVNGFEKTTFWSVDKVRNHGKRYSKTFNNGTWQTDFDSMAKKTVLKNTLSKWGILSIEMQKAAITDQAVIKNIEGDNIDVEYPDNYTDAEIVQEENSQKADSKVQKINNDLKNLMEKKGKTEPEIKPEKLTFGSEEEARKFFTEDMGILPENLTDKKLFETANELNIEIVIKNKV